MRNIINIIKIILNEKYKNKLETQRETYQFKREKLKNAYETLLSIIELYPNSSPNDVLKCVEFPPNYLMESFDSVLQALDYQIEDYKGQLNNGNIDNKRKNDIKVQISNREYSKKEIAEIRDKYFTARDTYDSFCKSNKVLFDLYAGQAVRNCLVEFEVLIHNVFICGRYVSDDDEPSKNRIEIVRRRLIDSIRNDIGIY